MQFRLMQSIILESPLRSLAHAVMCHIDDVTTEHEDLQKSAQSSSRHCMIASLAHLECAVASLADGAIHPVLSGQVGGCTALAEIVCVRGSDVHMHQALRNALSHEALVLPQRTPPERPAKGADEARRPQQRQGYDCNHMRPLPQPGLPLHDSRAKVRAASANVLASLKACSSMGWNSHARADMHPYLQPESCLQTEGLSRASSE